MKFFSLILISSFLSPNWACLYGVPDTPEPFHLLYSQYSKLHNLLPRNNDPNISCQVQETLAEEAGTSDLLVSLQEHLYLWTVDILYAYEYDPYLLLPLVFVHFPNHRFELTNLDTFAVNLLLEHDNDILSPKPGDNLNYLSCGNSFDTFPYDKANTFIETKVSAMKLQGFNL